MKSPSLSVKTHRLNVNGMTAALLRKGVLRQLGQLRHGQLVIVEDGEVVSWTRGHTLSLAVEADAGMARRTDAYLQGRFGAGLSTFTVPDAAFPDREVFEQVSRASACRT